MPCGAETVATSTSAVSIYAATVGPGERHRQGARGRVISARTSWAAVSTATSYVHRGAGAYICGEETALIESLEGKRGWPRIKPPFPAIHGLFIARRRQQRRDAGDLPPIVMQRRRLVQVDGDPSQPGPKVFLVERARQEARRLRIAAGVDDARIDLRLLRRRGRDGTSSRRSSPVARRCPCLLDDQLDIIWISTIRRRTGIDLGSTGIIVMDDTTCLVWAAMNLLYFYWHESCGQCTPCREGGDWLYKILTRIENGEGEMRDIGGPAPSAVGNNIAGKTLCAFGDAAATRASPPSRTSAPSSKPTCAKATARFPRRGGRRRRR